MAILFEISRDETAREATDASGDACDVAQGRRGSAWDWVYPPLCWLCGSDAAWEGGRWASGCDEHMLPDGPVGQRCPVCAGWMPDMLAGASRCAACRRATEHGASFGVERLIVLADYRAQPEVRDWVLAFKHGGRKELARPLASALAAVVRRTVRSADGGARGGDVLVPVPLHLWRRIERGFDQSRALAGALSGELGWPTTAPLARVRATVVQGAAGARSRDANVRGAFGPRRWSFLAQRAVARAECVWIVDDVVTSGATLRECARALRRMGARRVAALAIARASERGAPVESGRESEVASGAVESGYPVRE